MGNSLFRFRSPSTEAELTDDVLAEILLKLPINLLIKFRRVSKRWHRLITSDTFAYCHYLAAARAQINISNFRMRIFVLTSNNFSTRTSVSFGRQTLDIAPINQSINLPPHMQQENKATRPMLLSLGFGIYCGFYQTNGAVFLWNPSTGQTKVLPTSPYYRPTCRFRSYYFGGMYYKEAGTFCYKVGRISINFLTAVGGKIYLSLEVYSSKTGSWKLIPNFDGGELWDYAYSSSNCANLNGRAHLLIRSHGEDSYITSFDYESEVFRRIRIPLAPNVGVYDGQRDHLTVYDEKFLCLIRSWSKNDQQFLDIWVMPEYGVEASWTKEFTFGPIPMDMKVLGFSRKIRGIFLQKQPHNPNQLHRYLAELVFCDYKSAKIVGSFSFTNYGDRNLQILERTKSLISLA